MTKQSRQQWGQIHWHTIDWQSATWLSTRWVLLPTVLIVILLAFSDLRVREHNKEFKKKKV